MLGNKNRQPKTLVALGAIGLLVALWTPKASAQLTAQGPFSNGNYSGRYACLTATDDEFATAVIKYNPDGSGKYTAGTLIADEAGMPLGGDPSHFCAYDLDTTKSSYTLTSHGVGNEILVWNPSAANDATCPCSSDANLCEGNKFYTEQTAFAIRNQLNSNGFTTRADHSSTNLFDGDEPGNGYCVK
jgi:hypothetical protein